MSPRPAGPTPRVSVVMAAYNARAFIDEAVASILGQSFRDFEFVIVEDGSTDGTRDRLRALDDPRIILIENNRNLKQSASLNIGVRAARGAYIARMDADDVAHPDRLAEQLRYLDAHPEIGILGTDTTIIDLAGRTIGRAQMPFSPAAVTWATFTRNPFAHPTVMIRRAALAPFCAGESGPFHEGYNANQDLELWTRMLIQHKGSNLARPLLRYRVHSNQLSVIFREEQMKTSAIFLGFYGKALLPDYDLSAEDLRIIFLGIHSSRHEAASLRIDVIRAGHRFLDLFEHFRTAHPEAGRSPDVVKDVITCLSKGPLVAITRPGWLQLAQRAVKICPNLPLTFARQGAAALARRRPIIGMRRQ